MKHPTSPSNTAHSFCTILQLLLKTNPKNHVTRSLQSENFDSEFLHLKFFCSYFSCLQPVILPLSFTGCKAKTQMFRVQRYQKVGLAHGGSDHIKDVSFSLFHVAF